jgi:hypothetical protein
MQFNFKPALRGADAALKMSGGENSGGRGRGDGGRRVHDDDATRV